MENEHKLLAIASSQAQGVCHDTVIDRFTTLPDEIAQHIVSLLYLWDLVRAIFRECSMAAPTFDTSYLRIYNANLNNALAPGMVYLLRGMSNLNTLVIKFDPKLFFREPKACGFNGKYWKSQNMDFVNQLNDVTIEVSNGNNSWQLTRFILEHAQNLKKITIFYLPRKQHAIDKLSNSKKVSSATIDFREKRWR